MPSHQDRVRRNYQGEEIARRPVRPDTFVTSDLEPAQIMRFGRMFKEVPLSEVEQLPDPDYGL